MSKTVDIIDFARRVERLCEFLLDKASKKESGDLKILHDLKEDAADIHFGNDPVEAKKAITDETLTGLSEFMKGVPLP